MGFTLDIYKVMSFSDICKEKVVIQLVTNYKEKFH